LRKNFAGGAKEITGALFWLTATWLVPAARPLLDDYGPLGRVWRETNEAEADRATLIHDLLDGQFSSPAGIVASNTAERWSRDLTEDIASELRQHFAERGEILSSLKEFLEEHHG
jgi:hypothetical protein